MKKIVTLKDINGNIIQTGGVEIPNKEHLQAQIKYPHLTQKPKKGKGSFKRNIKHRKQLTSNVK